MRKICQKGAEMRLSGHNEHTATFEAGEGVVVAVELSAAKQRDVCVRYQDLVHQGRFDLLVDKQRDRFCRAAQGKLGCSLEPADFDHIQEVVAGLIAPPEVPLAQNDDGTIADTILDAADPWAALQAFREDTGWVGDEQAWGLGLLTLASRSLPHPLWLSVSGAGALKMLMALAQAVPEEWREHPNKVTAGGIRSADLRHRVLVLDDFRSLRADARLALQIEAAKGTSVALLGVGPSDIPMIAVELDDSPEQTKRVQRAALSKKGDCHHFTTGIQAIVRRLPHVAVEIPYADRIRFPSQRTEHRQELEWLEAISKPPSHK
jgi:hypothetical protein